MNRKPTGRAPLSVLSSRLAWVALGIVVVVLLAIGSYHPGPSTKADRISYLESVIKCPVCEDVSVAGSNAQQAVNLRAKIVQLVDDGATNSAVEAYVVSQFGTDELLRPSNSWLWALPIAGCGAGAIAVVGFLYVRSRDVAKPVRATEDERLVAVALGREMPAGELQ